MEALISWFGELLVEMVTEHLIWINKNKEKFNSDYYISMLSDDEILDLIK